MDIEEMFNQYEEAVIERQAAEDCFHDLRSASYDIQDAIAARMKAAGKKSMVLPDGRKLKIRRKPYHRYDYQKLMESGNALMNSLEFLDNYARKTFLDNILSSEYPELEDLREIVQAAKIDYFYHEIIIAEKEEG